MKKRVKLQYRGSLFWLIFWLVLFFPVALVLLATGATFILDDRLYAITYDGSRFWLCFWTIFCFPIAILLGVLNGISLDIDEPTMLLSKP